jgi:hypothetical protein
MQTAAVPDQKIITVSGLYSGVGKTEFCQRIAGLLPGIAAIKVTMNDRVTEVLDDEALIMVAGKDTWRLKTSGAGRVVWVRAQQEHLNAALADALGRCRGYAKLLIEGNSVLGHITPSLAVFICDDRVCADKPLKPSRQLALQKSDIIIYNLRPGTVADVAQVASRLKSFNSLAPVHALDVRDRQQAVALLKGLLHKYVGSPQD